MKVVLSNLSNKFVNEFKLKKFITNFFIKEEIEAEIIYDKDDYKYLLESTTIADDKETGDMSIQCGEDMFQRMVYLKHNEGKFDFKNCLAYKKVSFMEKLDCLVNRQINIFDYTASVTSTVNGEIQRESYSNSVLIYVGEYLQEQFDIYNLDAVLSLVGTYPDKSAQGYQIESITVAVYPEFEYREDIILGSFQEYGIYLGHRIDLYVQYARFYSPDDLGQNWLPLPTGGFYLKYEIVSDWAAPEIGKTSQLNSFGDRPEYGVGTYTKGRYSVFTKVDISNTVSLNEILIDVFSCTGFEFISNFFDINSDNSNANSPEYEYASEFCHNVKIVQSYDIIREAAIDDSFGISGLIETKDLLTDLCNLFNLAIVIDYPALTIRLEHISYFVNKGIDLTGTDYEIAEVDVNRDQIDAEVFNMAAETPTEGFYEVYVKYANLDLYSEPNEKRYSTKLIITDVTGTINNKLYEQDEYKKLYYLISTSNGALNDLNTPFSLRNIFNRLHQIGRPAKTGTIDGQQVNFGSFSIGMKTSIKINSNVGSWELINPYMSLKTEYGTFLIQGVELDEKNVLTLNCAK